MDEYTQEPTYVGPRADISSSEEKVPFSLHKQRTVFLNMSGCHRSSCCSVGVVSAVLVVADIKGQSGGTNHAGCLLMGGRIYGFPSKLPNERKHSCYRKGNRKEPKDLWY